MIKVVTKPIHGLEHPKIFTYSTEHVDYSLDGFVRFVCSKEQLRTIPLHRIVEIYQAVDEGNKQEDDNYVFDD